MDLVLQGSGGRLKFALSVLGCGPDLVFEADEFGNGKMQKLNGIGACSDNVATLCRSGPLDHAKDHGPQCGYRDAARNAPTHGTAKAAEQQTSDEGPDMSNHKITNQPKTTALDNDTSHAACDQPCQ